MVGKQLSLLLALLLLTGTLGHSHSHHSHKTEEHGHAEHSHGHGHVHSTGDMHAHSHEGHTHPTGDLHAHSHEGHSHIGHSHTGQGGEILKRYVDIAALQTLSEAYGTTTSAYTCTAFLSISAVIVFALFGLIGRCVTITQGFLNPLMAFAAGSLLGDVFFHMLPETDNSTDNWLLIITGVFLFYLLDKLFTSEHSHQSTHSPVFLYLFADAVHNFMDGMAIAVAFRAKTILGIITTLAVFIHELPHELADFVVLLKSGRSLGKALWLQCVTGAVALVGTWVALSDVSKAQIDSVGLPLVIGNFLYLALVNMMGELRTTKSGLVTESLGFLLGVYLMFQLSLLE